MPKQVSSPVSMPARSLSDDELPQLLFVTGPSEIGKSTYCLQLVCRARLAGLRPAGFIAVPVFLHNQKVAIDWVNQASGDRRRLAVRCKEGTGKFDTAKWRFDPLVLQWADQKLCHLSTCDLLFIDELGPLEFQRGCGLQAAFRLIAQRQIPHIVAVVRPALLSIARERWPWGHVLDLSFQHHTQPWLVQP